MTVRSLVAGVFAMAVLAPIEVGCAPSVDRLLRRKEYNDAMRAASLGPGTPEQIEHSRSKVAKTISEVLDPSLDMHVVSGAELRDADPSLAVPTNLDEDVVILVVECETLERSITPSVDIEVRAGDRRLEVLEFSLRAAAHLTGEIEALDRLSGSRQMKRGRNLIEGVLNAASWMTGGGEWVEPSYKDRVRAAPKAYALVKGLTQGSVAMDPSKQRLVVVMARPRTTSQIEVRIVLTSSAYSTDHHRLDRELSEAVIARGLPLDVTAALRWEVRQTLDLEVPRASATVRIVEDGVSPQWVEPESPSPAEGLPPPDAVLIGHSGLRGTLYCSRFTQQPAVEPRQPVIGQVPVTVSPGSWSNLDSGALVVAHGSVLSALDPEPINRWDFGECTPGTDLAGEVVVQAGIEVTPARPSTPGAFAVRSVGQVGPMDFVSARFVGDDLEITVRNPADLALDPIELTVVYQDCHQQSADDVVETVVLETIQVGRMVRMTFPGRVDPPSVSEVKGPYLPGKIRLLAHSDRSFVDVEEPVTSLMDWSDEDTPLDQMRRRCFDER